MRRTPVHNNKYKKATVPALTFIFKPDWNFPCNRVLAQTEIWSCNRPLRNMGVRWQDKARKYFSKRFNELGLKIMHSQIQPENCELFGRNSKSLSRNVLHIQKEHTYIHQCQIKSPAFLRQLPATAINTRISTLSYDFEVEQGLANLRRSP